jgi:uncharacterized membrane protein YhaH (DUF805 family)
LSLFDTGDLMASAGRGTHNTLIFATSIEGGENSPPVPVNANEPGLNATNIFRDQPKESSAMGKHWIWIVVIIVVLLGLFFFWPSATVTV